MPLKADPDNWAELHREDARKFFQAQLAQALGVHLPFLRTEGHLTKDDLHRELVAAMMVVMATDKALDIKKELPYAGKVNKET